MGKQLKSMSHLNRYTKLRYQFQLISVVVLLIATTLLGLVFKYSMNKQVEFDAVAKNGELIRLLTKEIEMSVFSAMKRVSFNFNDADKVKNSRLLRKIRQSVKPNLTGYYESKIRLYNMDGVSVYSDANLPFDIYSENAAAFKKVRLGQVSNHVPEKDPLTLVSWIPVYKNRSMVAIAMVSRNISTGIVAAKKQMNLVIWALFLTAITLHFMYAWYTTKIYQSLQDYEKISDQQQEKQEFLAYHDSLTSFPNRELFIDRLIHAAAKVDRSKELLAVLFIDLDRFKLINDSLGYSAGNEIVKMVADRLKTAIRGCDTIARVGGDEFTILLETIINPQEAVYVVERINKSLEGGFIYQNQEVNLTASTGISIYPQDEGCIEELINHADVAKDKAKKNGGADFRFYTRDMNVRSWERLEMEKDLRHGLEKNQYVLHFQPKVDLVQGRITGMEALLRWQRSEGELVPPIKFISMLEETGLIIDVGEWVLRESCHIAKGWLDQGYSSMVMAVNVSARQFRQVDFVERVYDILDETGLPPELLEIEVTEGVLMEDTQGSASTLEALKQRGIRIAIDDFGTGYSSLSYLQRYPIDTLKIDRAFVKDIENNSEGVAITTTIIALAHNLQLHIVAEGVETNEQLEFLTALGCQDIQGFLFSKPLPYDDFCDLLENEAQMFSRVFALRKNTA
ncbi:diguanylate cyclase/phosphodiesterase (GGDEF & EAL domains) with PAS/PAC sensor(s) [hydrothermal vent metagenome]|uniref:Diguanylate cyclase/phosphodiesterase (GGDEF & EAL domains) with PAS/PAC sensor(S) n=1 Tax=hydrothermal vent metagenome TaxID=652676 RepID=A0A3B0YZ07_9ZZZZ